MIESCIGFEFFYFNKKNSEVYLKKYIFSKIFVPSMDCEKSLN